MVATGASMGVFDDLAKNLAKQGAPVLGGIIGTAIGGPAGTLVGTLAGKAIEAVAETLGTDPTPEAISSAIENDPGATAKVQAAESRAGDMIQLWQEEAKRVSDAQAAEIAKGFTAWQAMRVVIQVIVWGGWAVLGLAGVFGGNWGVRPLVQLTDLISAWGTVTTVWLIVFHGGHTAKEVLPALKFGRGS
jgi:outer membrane lipoprotein SlyB